MSRHYAIIGAPSSAGAFSPGQEKAPIELRAAGLVSALQHVGLDVDDRGDLPMHRYSNDPENPYARNVAIVASNAKAVADAVFSILEDRSCYILLGGDCTNGAGAIAGATRDRSLHTGVVYLDMHADLNTPRSVRAGALDWMGMAHLMGVDGVHETFRDFEGRSPVISPDEVVFLGWDFVGSNSDWERQLMIRKALRVVMLDELKADPEASADRAIRMLGPIDRFVVHFDVDLIDFEDCPLGENYRHGEGCTLDQAMSTLRTLCNDKRFAGLSITELNPDHGDEDRGTLKRFVGALASALESATAV
jgi:arginase